MSMRSRSTMPAPSQRRLVAEACRWEPAISLGNQCHQRRRPDRVDRRWRSYNERTDQASAILAVTTDSPIRTPQDLSGKSIGVPTLVGLTTACLRAWLPEHEIDVSTVKLVEIPQSSTVPALQRGTIDVGLLGEPFVTFGKGQVRSIGSPYDAAADLSPSKTFCVSVWYHPSHGGKRTPPARALGAIYDTARWANTHRDDTFGILVRDGKLDPDKARGMLRTTYATSLTPALIQPIITIATQNKMFSKPVDAAAIVTRA